MSVPLKPIAAILLTCTGFVLAQSAGPRLEPVRFTDTTLDNGLRVIISEDRFAPVFALAIGYKVGSRDEREGHTGLAHLMERLMYRGSENVGAGEHYFDVLTKGGNASSSANADRTLFYEEFPRNQLDLALYLESDRMHALNINKESLDKLRQAIREERRQGLDNQPYGPTSEKVDDLLFDNFPYKHAIIGSTGDLESATIEEVQQFYKTYFAPNNAVLALAGDVDPKETLAKVKKYFAAIPRQTAPKPAEVNEPEKTGERRGRMEDRLAPVARLEIAYTIPPANTPDTRALIAAATILGGGESSRLVQKAVREHGVALQVGCIVDPHAGPSTFRVVAFIRQGKSPEETEALFTEEIAKLSTEPVTGKELERVHGDIRRGIPASRESMVSIAASLAEDAASFNDPNRINTEPEKRLAVSAADIQKAARTWLKATNRVVVVTEPAARQGGSSPR